MRPEYSDFFYKEIRYWMVCNLCGAVVIQDSMHLHNEWHETLGGEQHDERGSQP